MREKLFKSFKIICLSWLKVFVSLNFIDKDHPYLNVTKIEKISSKEAGRAKK